MQARRHWVLWVSAAICLLAAAAQAEDTRPPGAGTGKVVGHIASLGGSGSHVIAGGKSYAATVGFPLLRSDQLAVPPGEFLVVGLANGYLVRVDEDLTIAVTDLANLDSPPTHESLADQLDQLLTPEEKNRAERIAGAQARQTAARTVAPQASESRSTSDAEQSGGAPPPPPELEPAAPPPPPASAPAPAPAPSIGVAMPPPPTLSKSVAAIGSSQSGGGAGLARRSKKRAASRVSLAIVSATGQPRSVLQDVLDAQATSLDRCFRSIRKASREALVLQLSISRAGAVQTLSVRRDLYAKPKLERCVRAELSAVSFPRAQMPVRVEATLSIAAMGHRR